MLKEREHWPMHSRSTQVRSTICFLHTTSVSITSSRHSPTLNLYGNWIYDEGARALADALKINQVRSTICFDHTPSSLSLPLDTHRSESNENWIGAEGARALGDALKINQVRSTICFHDTVPSPSLPLDTHHSESNGKQPYRFWRSDITGRCTQDQRGEINRRLPWHSLLSPSLSLDTHHSDSRLQPDRFWRSESTGWCAQDQRGEINNLLPSHSPRLHHFL